MPSQVLISLPPKLKEFLASCEVEGAADLASEESADLDELYRLAEQHAQQTGIPVKMHELLVGSEVVERREAPALGEDGQPLSELEQLRAASQERAYQRMVDGVTPLRTSKTEPLAHQQGLKFATNFGTQVIVAFIGAFLLGYYFVETFVAPENFNAKVIAGAACSFATLLLETMLLVVHEQKQSMIQQKRESAKTKSSRRVVAVKEPVEPKPSLDKKETAQSCGQRRLSRGAMPLIKIFSRQPLKVSARKLHPALAEIWGVSSTPAVLKILCLATHDASGPEEVYVDVRAKQKPERTDEVLQTCCRATIELLARHGHSSKVRLETYEPSLQFTAE